MSSITRLSPTDCEEQSGVSEQSTQFEDTDDCNSEVCNRDVTVKFQVDNAQTIAQTYPSALSIIEVKRDIAEKFQVKEDDILFKQCNVEVPNSITISDVVTNEFGVIDIQLDLTDDAIDNDVVLDTSVYFSKFPLNEIITVHVPAVMSRSGCATDVIVEIENRPITKPFIGGFRNIYTGMLRGHPDKS